MSVALESARGIRPSYFSYDAVFVIDILVCNMPLAQPITMGVLGGNFGFADYCARAAVVQTACAVSSCVSDASLLAVPSGRAAYSARLRIGVSATAVRAGISSWASDTVLFAKEVSGIAVALPVLSVNSSFFQVCMHRERIQDILLTYRQTVAARHSTGGNQEGPVKTTFALRCRFSGHSPIFNSKLVAC